MNHAGVVCRVYGRYSSANVRTVAVQALGQVRVPSEQSSELAESAILNTCADPVSIGSALAPFFLVEFDGHLAASKFSVGFMLSFRGYCDPSCANSFFLGNPTGEQV